MEHKVCVNTPRHRFLLFNRLRNFGKLVYPALDF